MNFKHGDRVRVLRLDNEDVDFTATLERNEGAFDLVNCSDSSYEGETALKSSAWFFGEGEADYYEHITDDTMTVRQFEQLNPDIISVNRFINLAEQQRRKGLEKYRTSLEDAELSVEELITHAEEEIVDNWNYLQAIRAQYRSEQS